MGFNSLAFLVFLPAVLAAYYAVPRRWQNAVIFVASCIFYGWWDWFFLALLVCSIVVDFNIGLALGRAGSPRQRRLFLALSVCVNLGLLGYLKYYDFFVTTLGAAATWLDLRLHPATIGVLLPVGISFYTFHALSYTIDVYRRRIEPARDFTAYASYVSFFPQLVAGPISRSVDVLPQFLRVRTLSLPVLADGGRLILWGYFKKLVVADNLDALVATGFSPAARGGLALLSMYGFAFQVYADFSGYTDIARGLAKLMGFELPLNFDRPYLARTIPEFWKRWHMSLSTWFREYLYIPLGGNRCPRPRHLLNIMVTFVASGLWHGADLRFIVWGFLHGLGYLPSVLRRGRPPSAPPGFLASVAGWFLVFHFVLVAWVFFRANSVGAALRMLRRVAEFVAFGVGAAPPSADVGKVVALGGTLLLAEWLRRGAAHPLELGGATAPLRVALTSAIFLAIMLFGNFDNVPFIYFQF